MTDANPIRNVSDTALWVAVYRAMETERPDALFNDPFARRLAGERGQAIVDAMPSGKSMSWPMVVRTQVMDEIILRCVRQGATTILKPRRGPRCAPVPACAPGVGALLHVDLPEMLDYFRERMSGETPRLRARVHRRRPARCRHPSRTYARVPRHAGPCW